MPLRISIGSTGVCSDGLGLCGRSSISIPAAMGPRVWNRGRSFLCCGRHCVPAVHHPEGSVGKEETGGIIELETAINGNLNHNEKKKKRKQFATQPKAFHAIGRENWA